MQQQCDNTSIITLTCCPKFNITHFTCRQIQYNVTVSYNDSRGPIYKESCKFSQVFPKFIPKFQSVTQGFQSFSMQFLMLSYQSTEQFLSFPKTPVYKKLCVALLCVQQASWNATFLLSFSKYVLKILCKSGFISHVLLQYNQNTNLHASVSTTSLLLPSHLCRIDKTEYIKCTLAAFYTDIKNKNTFLTSLLGFLNKKFSNILLLVNHSKNMASDFNISQYQSAYQAQ